MFTFPQTELVCNSCAKIKSLKVYFKNSLEIKLSQGKGMKLCSKAVKSFSHMVKVAQASKHVEYEQSLSFPHNQSNLEVRAKKLQAKLSRV